jgi:hypothetical protein
MGLISSDKNAISHVTSTILEGNKSKIQAPELHRIWRTLRSRIVSAIFQALVATRRQHRSITPSTLLSSTIICMMQKDASTFDCFLLAQFFLFSNFSIKTFLSNCIIDFSSMQHFAQWISLLVKKEL